MINGSNASLVSVVSSVYNGLYGSILNLKYAQNVQIYCLKNVKSCHSIIVNNEFGHNLSIISNAENGLESSKIYGPQNGLMEVSVSNKFALKSSQITCNSDSMVILRCDNELACSLATLKCQYAHGLDITGMLYLYKH